MAVLKYKDNGVWREIDSGKIDSIKVGGTTQPIVNKEVNITSIPYLTTAPTENRANDGTLVLVVLDSDPPAYYQGYEYHIKE